MTAHVQPKPSLQQRFFTTYCQGISLIRGHFCDLKVIISGAVFECHRLLLASLSEFFRLALTGAWRESSSSTVEISHEDVTAESFQIFLDIVYEGHDVISIETVEGIFRMSVFLCVPPLEEFCVKFMSENITADKCLHFLFLAQTYNLPSLCDCAVTTAYRNFSVVHRQAEFASVPKPELLLILTGAVMNTCVLDKSSMDDILQAVLLWVESDKVRHPHLGELLPFVDPYRLSPGIKRLIVTRYAQHELGGVLLSYLGQRPSCSTWSHGRESEDADKAHTSHDTSWLTSNMSVTKCGVIVGGCNCSSKPSSSLVAFTLSEGSADDNNENTDDDDGFKMYSLSPLPESLEGAIVSCIWNNEVYVSGAVDTNKINQYFAVYRTTQNRWEMLPPPPVPRLEYAMVAASFNIYFIGGCTEADVDHPVSDILVYHTRTGTWGIYGSLLEAVASPKAAAVGHRVYVFGGWKWEEVTYNYHDSENSFEVQCIDTLKGNVYIAGNTQRDLQVSIPEQVVSSGRTIFAMDDEGLIVQMVEKFALADERERVLASSRGRHTLLPLALNVGNASSSSLALETDQNANLRGHMVRNSEPLTVETSESDSFIPTVSSRSIGNIHLQETCFNTYLHNDELIRCTQYEGRIDIEQEGQGFIHLIGFDLKNGKIKQRNYTLPLTRSSYNIHILNVPSRYLGTKERVFTKDDTRDDAEVWDYPWE
ncbi:hypothetical protein BaRGS_00027710, partial [Batillaria attramentaria]